MLSYLLPNQVVYCVCSGSYHQSIRLLVDLTMYSVCHLTGTVHTIYGIFSNVEPIILAIMSSQSFNRLRYVEQYGMMNIVDSSPSYSRFDHSVGVWALLRRYGAPIIEQVAGILHDVSHTVFSHLGDLLFADPDYQDNIHTWYIQNTELAELLARHRITAHTISPKNNGFLMLETELPDLCADRIDYIIQGGLRCGLLSTDFVNHFLDSLTFTQGKWVVLDVNYAKNFGIASLKMTTSIWGTLRNCVISDHMCNAMNRALEIGLISLDDVHFSIDRRIWNILKESDDIDIMALMTRVFTTTVDYHIARPEEQPHNVFDIKFRGVNPWVLTQSGLVQLCELDPDYANEYQLTKTHTGLGWHVCYNI